ncbi:3-oxoacyl-[acyl-carrier protein] reductase [hydrothermal vent metagenome]|uniref:3-oxoacyl-[acyl-carrier protein] reductase n=1 Tax=hydrothermal vent metagenome TaxID=652676 RepID=A0A3B0UCQ8_9ZZZZ
MKEMIRELIGISRYYGQQSQYVIAGGGNTSFKDKDKIWVKSSGHALATITEEGFAVLDRKKLQVIAEKKYSSDPLEREKQVKDDLAEANTTKHRRPSVETSLHNLMNFSFVVHLHPTLVNGVMCGNNAGEYVPQVFGEDALYIPYVDPGYLLFKEISLKIDMYRKERGEEPKVILLQNHGIFVGADTTSEIKAVYNRVFANIEAAIKDKPVVDELPVGRTAAEVLPALRMIASEHSLKSLKVRNNSLVAHFTEGPASFEKIGKPFTPDIIVYCKSKYIFIDNVSSSEAIINQFEKEYKTFTNSNGYAPKVALIKGLGLVAIGSNPSETGIILDVFEDMMKISWLSESFGGPHFMTPGQVSFIDNWEVENYRRKVSATASAGRLENKIAIVTGAAQGFGEGIARGMLNEGANIVVADLNTKAGAKTVASFNEGKGSNKAIFVQTDVSDMEQLNRLIFETVCEFGGLDIFISNAGILRAGGLDEMTPETFDLVTKINYNAYFYSTKAASKVMRLQSKYKEGIFFDIIQVNSKSGLSGSKRNFAYSGGKFGGIGLTQSFALELAPYRIKVNSICPGNYYEGPLWSDPGNGLFVQYLETGKVPGAKTVDDVRKYYMGQVPLQRGCSPGDVLKAVLYLVEQEYETGQALPVTGGQVMLR